MITPSGTIAFLFLMCVKSYLYLIYGGRVQVFCVAFGQSLARGGGSETFEQCRLT